MSGAGRESKLRDLSAREEQRRLSRDDLLRPRIIEKTQFIESLGGEVVVRSLSHELRQRLREQSGAGGAEFDEDKFTMLIIVNSVVDPKLTESDIEELRKQDASVIDELSLHLTMLNMMGRTEELGKD